ncbi:hypothetical protein ABVK36_03760 [Lonsdalea quercina]|uniref:hypothetical protein n=1 Tax=Lonsdalea quercina TaxID=71657 RepID=UPI003F44F34B
MELLDRKSVIMKFVIFMFVLLTPDSVMAKDNPLTASFVNEIKSSADNETVTSAVIDIVCPSPSASGKLLITEPKYDVGKSRGVYLFKDGTQTKLNFISPKIKGDDYSSDVVLGFDFGFLLSNGQFFLTIMKNGSVKAGINQKGKSGITEIYCETVIPS